MQNNSTISCRPQRDKKLLLEIIGNEKKWIVPKLGSRDPLETIGEPRKKRASICKFCELAFLLAVARLCIFSINWPRDEKNSSHTQSQLAARYEFACEPNRLLLDVLRVDLNLTGSKRGCDDSSCGACTVQVDGTPMLACALLAGSCEDQEIVTVEGIAEHGSLAAIQKAYGDWGGSQCGFCTPGFMVTVHWLLAQNPNPTEEEIRSALSGIFADAPDIRRCIRRCARRLKRNKKPCPRWNPADERIFRSSENQSHWWIPRENNRRWEIHRRSYRCPEC